MNKSIIKNTIIIVSIIFAGAVFSLPKLHAQATKNLIANPSFETSFGEGTSSQPTGWIKGDWGTNAVNFSYPVTGPFGASDKAAQVSLASRTSGDAKWAFIPVNIDAG